MTKALRKKQEDCKLTSEIHYSIVYNKTVIDFNLSTLKSDMHLGLRPR